MDTTGNINHKSSLNPPVSWHLCYRHRGFLLKHYNPWHCKSSPPSEAFFQKVLQICLAEQRLELPPLRKSCFYITWWNFTKYVCHTQVPPPPPNQKKTVQKGHNIFTILSITLHLPMVNASWESLFKCLLSSFLARGQGPSLNPVLILFRKHWPTGAAGRSGM